MLETNQFFRNIEKNNPELRELKEQDIARIQQVLLGMLIDVDYVCRKYHLTYFLCGGSAIGAVRHQGFIPWDDDVDLAMPRKDYDLIGKYMLQEFPERYWVQNIAQDDTYDLSFGKVRKKGTKCVELFEPNVEKAGVFLDIFPVENTYSNPVARKLHGYLGEAFLLICSCVRLRNKQSRILPYLQNKDACKVVKRKVRIGTCFSFVPLLKWLRITEKILKACHNESSAWVSIPSGRKHYFGEMYSRSSFFPPKEIQFENRSFYIMNHPEEYLRKMYGDYMKLPPEEKREKHCVLELEV